MVLSAKPLAMWMVHDVYSVLKMRDGTVAQNNG